MKTTTRRTPTAAPSLKLSYVPPNIAQMVNEFTEGKPIGVEAGVDHIKEGFSWKRGFINCWTGWPNAGKSTFLMFLMMMMSIKQGWKWCLWSPEMMSSYINDKGEVIMTGSDIYDELVYMKTGKCPWSHYKNMFGIEQMPIEEYLEALSWVKDHFYVIDPEDTTPAGIIREFESMHKAYKFDGYLIDPFMNLDLDESGMRTDLYLARIFRDFRKFALKTNSCVNVVAHPKSQDEVKNPKTGAYKVCTQFMLSGGAAWNNNFDGIYSIYRPWGHKDPKEVKDGEMPSEVWFYRLKQRKQQLVGRLGVAKGIHFDFETNRYYFDGVCPIDGTKKRFGKDRPPMSSQQGGIKFQDTRLKPKEQSDFNKHLSEQWGDKTAENPPNPDDVPF
jgi:hypothetical protein